MNLEICEMVADRAGVTPYDVLKALRTEASILHDKNAKLFSEIIRDGQGVFHCLIHPQTKSKKQMPHTAGDYVGGIVQHICQRAWQSGYGVSYYVARNELADSDYYEWLTQKHPDAGLISIVPFSTRTISEACSRYHMPCVFIDYQGDEDHSAQYKVEVDNHGGIMEAMRHLIGLGHTQIGFITGILSMSSSQARLQGYKDALQEAGIPFDPALVAEGDWWSERAYQVTNHILNHFPRMTAIVASSDLTAFGAIMAINEQGLSIPHDISIIGFDDIPMAANVNPGLTTLRQPFQALAERATDLTIQLLRGQKPAMQHHRLPVELIIRGSTSYSPIR